jgi:hypothetical protein
MTFNNVRRHAIPLPKGLKDALRQPRLVRSLWTRYRERQVVTEYRARREHYARMAEERGLRYSLDGTRQLVRQRLAARGYTPKRRRRGEIHTFASFPGSSWHPHLLPDLRELGPVTWHDYQTLGFSRREFDSRDGQAFRRMEEMSEGILPLIRAAHEQRPIDWVFFYGGGHHVSPVVVRRITEELGIPVVNMSLDDKQGWAGAMAGPWRSGAIDLTREFDLFMTSARIACEWHLVEGGRPIYLPEGFDASAFVPRELARDLPVSFVGAAYGFRYSVAEELRGYGVPFHPYGAGWPAGYAGDVVEIFNRSVINLGMGGIEYSEELTNVKGRDFEIPGTGGGVYLTSFNPDLAQHFTAGEEILCYRNRDEMLELIRHYLARPDEAAEIAARGRARSLREHRWLHRYESMLELLGIL